MDCWVSYNGSRRAKQCPMEWMLAVRKRSVVAFDRSQVGPDRPKRRSNRASRSTDGSQHHVPQPKDPLATMAKVTSYMSEQGLDDGHELLPVLGGVPQQSGTDQDVVRAKLPELLSQDWDFGDSQVEWPRCPGQGPFHGSDKLRFEQRADAASHGRAMLLMAVVAPPDGVEEVGSDDLVEFRRRVKGLEGGWGPPRAEVRGPVRAVRLIFRQQGLVPPVVPLQSRRMWSLVSGARDGRRSRRQPPIAGGHPGNVADEQADHQGLGLIGTDLPACLILFMHGSHLSHRENCMIVAWVHVRKAIGIRDDQGRR